MQKQELIDFLDGYLQISEYSDASKNGLQVENSQKEIKKIGYAVDATSYIFEKAQQEDIDFLITHHGMFWGQEEVLTGISYERTKKILDADIALYTAHLPLDAHPEVGNNIGLAKAFVNIFGLREGEYEIESFSEYKGKNIGFGVKFKHKLHISNLVTPYAERMQLIKRLYNFGGETYFNSIGFISGGALGYLDDSIAAGYDVFVTGEGNHGKMIAAKEKKACVLIAGHYETEKIGVKLLAHKLERDFGLECVFLDEKY